MRFLTTLMLGTVLALPAVAQTTTHSTPHRARAHATVGHTGSPGHPTATDKGPFTSDADKAYMGGGVILEGQPGGPPPPASAAVGMPANTPVSPMQR